MKRKAAHTVQAGYGFNPSFTQKGKKIQIVGEDVGKLGPSYHAGGDVNAGPSSLISRSTHRILENGTHTDSCRPLLIAAPFTIIKRWKQPKCWPAEVDKQSCC